MITIYSNKYIDKTKKSLLTFSLATIFVISSISFLVQINSIENADATVDFSNTTISSEPPTITVKPPVDEKTGQTILPPPKALVEKDPITGQTDVVANVLTKDPIIKPDRIIQTITNNSTASDLDQSISSLSLNGLPVGIPIATLDSSLGLKQVEDRGNILPSTNTLQQDSSTFNPTNTLQQDSSTFNPTNTVQQDSSTFNPMFSKCDVGQFEMAKYSIIGQFTKDKVDGKDFSLDIFADLIDNDNSTFDSSDHPYKAYFNTNNEEKIPVELNKVMTICADITELDQVKKTDTHINK